MTGESSLPASLAGTLATGLKATGGSFATLGSDLTLWHKSSQPCLMAIRIAKNGKIHTCFSGSMLAKPWLPVPLLPEEESSLAA